MFRSTLQCSLSKTFYFISPKYSTKTPLTKQHAEYLSLVSNQGEGNVKMEVLDNVAVLSFSNPSKRNAMSGKMMNNMAELIDQICDDTCPTKLSDRVVGLILKGCGNEAFCAGADFSLVKTIVNTPEKGVLMSQFMTDALNRLRQSRLISVCVINGPALGGGAEITTTCDFRLMVNSSKSFVQFVHAKIGASPGWGGAHRLTNIVGRKEALKMCAASIPVYADQALTVGFVDALVALPESGRMAEEDLVGAAVTFLQPYLSQPYPGSVHAIKTAVASVEDLSSEESRQTELEEFRRRWFGADNRAALSKK